MARLALTLVLFLAMAGPAQAGGSVIVGGTEDSLGGVWLAGELVVWATIAPDGSGLDVHVARHDGGRERVRRVRVPDIDLEGSQPLVGLAASAQRIAVGIHVLYCPGDCKYQNYETRYSRTLTGPLEGELATVSMCEEGYGADPRPIYPRVEVDGNVMASRGPCDGDVTVRDFDSGFQAAYPDGRHVFQLRGRYLATNGREFTLRDWRTGEVLRQGATTGAFDLQADGKRAFLSARGEQSPVIVTSLDGSSSEVAADSVGPPRIARDRVAYHPRSGGVIVRSIEPGFWADSRHAVLDDFDGDRIVWSARPCAVFSIVTWDLRGLAPTVAPRPCPLASPRNTTLRARIRPGDEWVPIKLTCPAKPVTHGCGGTLRLLARDGRPRPRTKRLVTFADGSFRLAAGERASVAVPFAEGGICAVRRHGLRPLLEISSRDQTYGTLERRKRHRVKLTGIGAAVERCGHPRFP